MPEIVKASVYRDDYPDPQVGDRYRDDELGELVLVEITPIHDSFDLTYERVERAKPAEPADNLHGCSARQAGPAIGGSSD